MRFLSIVSLSWILLSEVEGAGLFNPNSKVLELSGTTFEKKIHKTKQVTFAKFYAPWCGHCKKLAPIYSKVADKLHGIAKLVSINCDEEVNKPVCGKYDVKGFPTLKLFPSAVVTKGKKKVPLDYNGGRTKKEITQFIIDSLPDRVQIVVDGDKNTKKIKNHNSFLQLKSTDDKPTPKILLFTDKSDTPPLYKALGLEFHDRATFGLVRKKQVETIAKYDVTKFPTLLVLPTPTDENEGVEPIVYDGVMKHGPLSEFLESHALPKIGKKGKKEDKKSTKKEGKKKSTKKEDEKKSTKKEKKATKKETKEEEQPDSTNEDKSTEAPITSDEETFDSTITELVEQDEFETSCLDESGICILSLFYPGDNSNYLEKVKDAKEMVHDLKKMSVLPSATPKINFHYAIIQPHTSLLEQFNIPTSSDPITLLLQPNKKLYAFRSHPTEKFELNYLDFLEEAVKDKVKFSNYDFKPELKRTKLETEEKDEL